MQNSCEILIKDQFSLRIFYNNNRPLRPIIESEVKGKKINHCNLHVVSKCSRFV